ncbi:hypothetical protein N8465_01080 [Akkermansiaceae bacterium]|nr:hypothetical protein [Akkermansiaceae bacterium]MDB4521510.1 hypothetical protein [Akkermansiaceae bacterium]
MDMDSSTLESELKKLVPTPLQDSLLDQLDDAMAAAGNEVSPSNEKIIVTALDTDLSDLEESLRRLVPYGVPENLISRLDDAMARWHEEVPVDEKIVEINRGVKRGGRRFLAFDRWQQSPFLAQQLQFFRAIFFLNLIELRSGSQTSLTGSPRQLFLSRRMRELRWFRQKIMEWFGLKAGNRSAA